MLNQLNRDYVRRKLMSIVINAIQRKAIIKAKSFLVKHRPRPKKTYEEIVVCPVCKEKVMWTTNRIYCAECQATYPIIPRMVISSEFHKGQ